MMKMNRNLRLLFAFIFVLSVSFFVFNSTANAEDLPPFPPDVSMDGQTDITDVLIVIDIIFGNKTPTDVEFSAANQDFTNQTIDITDLLEYIDIIFDVD